MGDFREIKEIANRYTPEEIEGCITQQIETGRNICLTDATSQRIINELSKASFIRQKIEEGMTLPDAVRELAERMRRFSEVRGI